MAAGDPGVLKRNFSATAIETTLVNSISSASTGDTTTSVSVVSVSGFPSVPYTLILGPDTNREEVVTVTAASSTTLTIVRGQDGTQAQSHTAGTSVRHGVSGRDFKEEQTHIAARGYDADTGILSNAGQTHVHGLVSGDGSVVGSTQAVLLTRKTLGTGTSISSTVDNSSGTISGGTITSTTVTASTVRSSTLTNDTLGSDLAAGGYVVTGLGAPVNANDSTRKAYVDSILGSATAASTSAASAATSATSAATSATSAATSATSSATSASAAATSASSALTSQTAAATSATSAAASATAAATSATSAAASATASASSASASATSAGAAATSASSAATSATASATSAGAAATSAASAATSATSSAASTSAAAASATAAATSATSAAASATAAATSATSAATSASASASSATAAATSATSAATSASSALTSQTAAATSAASAATSASSAATSYDDFDDRYLGSKSTAPTVDNDGNTLLVGALYWNSVSNLMFAWSGSAWVQITTTSSYSAPTLGSTTINSGTTYSTITGLTLSGGLTAADPTVALGVANKQYVDAVVTQINYHQAVTVATTSNIAANYNNGSSGVGATLTADTLRAWTGLDGVSTGFAVGNRVLIKDQTTALQNGIYTITNLGSAGVTAWVLTRATDADNNPSGEMRNGDEVSCLSGTANGGKSFINSTATDPIVIGTTAITFSVYYASLPSQTSNSGKFLTTDGTTPSWGTVLTNPLTNTGSNAGDAIYAGSVTPTGASTGDIWIDNTVSTDPDLTTMTIMGAY